MTDMQRYIYGVGTQKFWKDNFGEYVLASDADAAIAAARQDMLAKCIAAVQQALDKFWEESDADELGWLEQHELYVAALRALQEKQ